MTSARVRLGWEAANRTETGAPSDVASSAARLLPAASSTALRSLTRVSRLGGSRPSTRSLSPVPRASNRISRATLESRCRKWANPASSQCTSRFASQPGTKTRSSAPCPTTWYAMRASPLLAYRVSGDFMQLPRIVAPESTTTAFGLWQCTIANPPGGRAIRVVMVALKWTVFGLVVGYIGFLALLYVTQRRLMYFPE